MTLITILIFTFSSCGKEKGKLNGTEWTGSCKTMITNYFETEYTHNLTFKFSEDTVILIDKFTYYTVDEDGNVIFNASSFSSTLSGTYTCKKSNITINTRLSQNRSCPLHNSQK